MHHRKLRNSAQISVVWVSVSPFPEGYFYHVKLWGRSDGTSCPPCWKKPRKVSPTLLMVTNRRLMLGIAIISTERYHFTMVFIFSMWEIIVYSTFTSMNRIPGVLLVSIIYLVFVYSTNLNLQPITSLWGKFGKPCCKHTSITCDAYVLCALRGSAPWMVGGWPVGVWVRHILQKTPSCVILFGWSAKVRQFCDCVYLILLIFEPRLKGKFVSYFNFQSAFPSSEDVKSSWTYRSSGGPSCQTYGHGLVAGLWVFFSPHWS